MSEKPGRNDPCPCGSGKKYKACCFKTPKGPKRKFSATVLSNVSQPKPIDLMERTYGDAIARSMGEEKPPIPPVQESISTNQ